MSLINRLCGVGHIWTYEPAPPAGPDPDATAAELRAARERIELLEQQLATARAAERRAIRDRDTAEQRLADLAITSCTPTAVWLARALKALAAQEDLLAGCRAAHGGNVAASSLPAHPLARCEWCRAQLSHVLADCAACPEGRATAAGYRRRQAALAGDPDIARETAAKRGADL